MFQNMQDDVPIEVAKIQVAPAFEGCVHQFPNYSLSNTEGASKLCAKLPKRYVKIITSKIISQYTGDNSHALEHGLSYLVYEMTNKQYYCIIKLPESTTQPCL